MGTRRAPGQANGFDLSKVLFLGLLSCGLLGSAFAVGLHAGIERNAVYRTAIGAATAVADSLKLVAGEASTILGTRPVHYLQEARSAGRGVTYNDPASNQDDLILLSGFFTDTNELRLIRRSGDVVARWPVRYYDIFTETDHFPEGYAPATNWNIDLHGAAALPDGSVVFNFEWGGLVKLDRCGGVVWTIRRQTHHSVERAEGGGFWVPARRGVLDGMPYPPFEPPYHEDTVLRVSEDGRILDEFSAVKVFYDSGLEALLTATGSTFHEGMAWDREVLHLNKVEELTSDIAAGFPLFEAGDLALSLRDLNLVMVVDPKGARIKWWKTGPWLRQHDPEFKAGGTLVVFNNNIFPTAFGERHASYKVAPGAPRITNIIELDPVSGEFDVAYGGRPGQELLSVIKGKVELTPGGGLLITEAQGGRARETDAAGRLVWEYVNRYSDEEVAELGEARLYSAGYFDVGDWSCGT